MITVVVADDHQMFMQGLKSMLDNTSTIEIVGEAINGLDALKCITKTKPNIAIIDISMPGINGIELCRRIKKHSKRTKCIILTMQNDPFFVSEAIDAGAEGYLLKEESFTSLIQSIHDVYNNKQIFSPSLQTEVIQNAARRSKLGKSCTIKLTKREREVIQQIAEGLTNSEIAKQLFISSQTVDTHRKNIMKKLDIHSVAGLVKYALRHGYITV